MKKDDLIDAIHNTAGADADFLWNECVDIADVMDELRKKLERMKKSELVELYEKAKQAKHFEGDLV